MLTLRSLLLLSCALICAAPCQAGRVYRLVDYPANQNGHFLKGTITTTDDAPSDSLLGLAEILSWQWNISGANTFAASSQDFLNDSSLVMGVQISNDAISIVPATIDNPFPGRVLQLSRETLSPRRGSLSHRLSWDTIYVLGDTNIYSASRLVGDAIQSFWSDTVDVDSDATWLIAIAVPEPATGLLLTTCVLLRRPTFSRG